MEKKEELKATIGLKVLCFCIPLVGLIIYACNVSQNRKYANQCGKASVIGLLTPILVLAIGFLINICIRTATAPNLQKETKSAVDKYQQTLEKENEILNKYKIGE